MLGDLVGQIAGRRASRHVVLVGGDGLPIRLVVIDVGRAVHGLCECEQRIGKRRTSRGPPGGGNACTREQ
jgi:hypothetical protein